ASLYAFRYSSGISPSATAEASDASNSSSPLSYELHCSWRMAGRGGPEKSRRGSVAIVPTMQMMRKIAPTPMAIVVFFIWGSFVGEGGPDHDPARPIS